MIIFALALLIANDAKAAAEDVTTIACVARSLPAEKLVEVIDGIRLPEEQRYPEIKEMRITLIKSAEQCAELYKWNQN
jgi:hypothetical protein